MSGPFGAGVMPYQAEDQMQTVFETWMDTYLRNAERDATDGDMSLAPIASWNVMSAAEQRFPAQALPGVQITWQTATLDIHAQDASAAIPVSVEVMVTSGGFGKARKRAGIYAYCLAQIAVEKLDRDPMFEGVADIEIGIPLTDKFEDRRWRSVAYVDFTVTVMDFMALTPGPTEPAPNPDNPPSDYPTALTVDVTVTPQ